MKGSAREHLFNQQRGQLDTISDSQGGQASPSSLAFSYLIWKREQMLHCIHPWPFIPGPQQR